MAREAQEAGMRLLTLPKSVERHRLEFLVPYLRVVKKVIADGDQFIGNAINLCACGTFQFFSG
jgi:hypothetical protein